MAVTYVGAASSNGGTASVTSTAFTLPAAAAAGDLLIACCVVERILLPTVTITDGGMTTLRDATGSANVSMTVAYKFLTSGDLGDTITGAVSTGRRICAGAAVYRGAGTPALTTGAESTSTALVMPSSTPAAADSMLVGVMGYTAFASPFNGRTMTASAGWTERVEDSATAAASDDPYVYFADKLLTGGAGVSQTGLTVTASSTGSARWFGNTIAIPPATGSAYKAGQFMPFFL